ncbi:MAG: phosphoribosylanthranilate isomerase [SAR324 cluster bacterium]|nr:phosphoribosylanthranilate isomerase [SAR324 cluster bacterium]
MTQTMIKICGLTTVEQVTACIEMGADWLGFNCYPKSKRYITPESIRQLLSLVPPKIKTVGVFVNEPLHSAEHVMEYTGMDFAQLHGDESSDYMKKMKSECFKAFRVSSSFQPKIIRQYPSTYFLLDSYHPDLYGGTGDPFNWEIAEQAGSAGHLILAGGLTPDNVQNAIMAVQPFGVDVCSGVETITGVKDLNLVQRFIDAVRGVTDKK